MNVRKLTCWVLACLFARSLARHVFSALRVGEDRRNNSSVRHQHPNGGSRRWWWWCRRRRRRRPRRRCYRYRRRHRRRCCLGTRRGSREPRRRKRNPDEMGARGSFLGHDGHRGGKGYGLVWFGLVWFGLVRFGSVRFGSVRCRCGPCLFVVHVRLALVFSFFYVSSGFFSVVRSAPSVIFAFLPTPSGGTSTFTQITSKHDNDNDCRQLCCTSQLSVREWKMTRHTFYLLGCGNYPRKMRWA